MSKKKASVRKGDFVILIACIVIGLVTLSIYNIQSGGATQGATLVISHTATNKQQKYDLNQDSQIMVEGSLGVSTIEISDGAARFLDSPCPDHICINVFGWISRDIDKSFCLPNEIMLEIQTSPFNG